MSEFTPGGIFPPGPEGDALLAAVLKLEHIIPRDVALRFGREALERFKLREPE